MEQKGFSSILMLMLVVALLVAGGAGYMMLKGDAGGAEEKLASSDDIASTTVSNKVTKETNNQQVKNVTKTKVKACDLLSESKVSNIVGVEMIYTPGLTEEERGFYDESAGSWTSLCSFVEKNGTVESNAGVVVTILEGLSDSGKIGANEMFENVRLSDGGEAISGLGDKAFKVNDNNDIGYNSYYVMKGNMLIWAYSAIGHGEMVGERLESVSSENKDDITEAVIKHVLSQI